MLLSSKGNEGVSLDPAAPEAVTLTGDPVLYTR